MLVWVVDIMWESLSLNILKGLLNLIILFSVIRSLKYKYLILLMGQFVNSN